MFWFNRKVENLVAPLQRIVTKLERHAEKQAMRSERRRQQAELAASENAAAQRISAKLKEIIA